MSQNITGGNGKIIAGFVILFAVILFIIFFTVFYIRNPQNTATSTPAAVDSGNNEASTTRESLGARFFKLLGFDFSTIRNLEYRDIEGADPYISPPSAISNPSNPPNPSSGSGGYSGELPFGFTREDLSPYYNQIQITSVWNQDLSSQYAFNNLYSEINIWANSEEGSQVNITGWKIRSNKDSITIPKGENILSPLAFRNEGNIVLKSGDQLRIFSNTSPSSINMRLNKCTGYLEGYNPEFPKLCPRLYTGQGQLSQLSGQCQDYLLSLSSCQVPASQPPIQFNDFQCQNILSRANYRDCFNSHRSDADFFASEWRVWLGSPSNRQRNILDPLHDRIRLFDSQGKIVSQYIY